MEILDIDETGFESRYAGFWIRFAAVIIDAIVLSFIIGPIIYLNLFIMGDSDMENMDEDSAMGMFTKLMIFAFETIYFAAFNSSKFQATPGKMAVGIKVIDQNGGRISFGQGIGRVFGKIISAVILYIGFIMAAFDSKKQALHDRMANTYVVYK